MHTTQNACMCTRHVKTQASYITHKLAHTWGLHPVSPLTIVGMLPSFFTRAGDSTLATRAPRGFAAGTEHRADGLQAEPLPCRSWECGGAGTRRGWRRWVPRLTHGADHVGRGSLVLREPQGGQLGRREDDQRLGQGTEALATHEEGKRVLDANRHAGYGTEHTPDEVQPRAQDGLQGPGRELSGPAHALPAHPDGSAQGPWPGEGAMALQPTPRGPTPSQNGSRRRF